MKTLVSVLLLASVTTAPFQCASDPDPNKRREETPGEALYGLAQQFDKEGDKAARIATLEFLVKRYPSSHEAETARVELGELGVVVPDGSAEPPAASAAAPEAASAPAAESASASAPQP